MAVVSLVIHHLSICPILFWQVLDNPNPVIAKTEGCIGWALIPDANMPLFTFISGFLFMHLLGGGSPKYQKFSAFFFNKIKRLVIPFLFFTPLVMLTSPKCDWVGLRYIDFFYGEGFHLWFLMMLFWSFMLGWMLRTHVRINIFVALISLGFYVFYNRLTIYRVPLGLHNAALYYCFFAIGGFTCMICKRRKLYDLDMSFSMMLLGLILLIIHHENIPHLMSLSQKLYSLTYVWMVFFFVKYLYEKGILRQNKIIDRICGASMGIYIIHHWVGWNFYHIRSVQHMLAQHQLLLPAIATILIFYLSYYLTLLLKRTSLGKMLF